MKTSEILKMIGFVLLVIGFVGACGFGIYSEAKHPCVEWRHETCSSTHCTWYMTPMDMTSPCLIWETEQVPCDICIRRKP